MVLGDEILQWLTDCGSNPNSVGSTTGSTNSSRDDSKPTFSHQQYTPAFNLQTSTSVASHSSSLPAEPPPTVNAPPERGGVGGGRKLLGQLSRELGKNLGGDGSRSSPLSPSDLAGRRFVSPIAGFFSFAEGCQHVCFHLDSFAGPAVLSISPQALFQQRNGRQQNDAKAKKTKSNLSSSAMEWNARGGSRPTTPAPAFSASASLGIKFRGSTGRSIDEWLQKRKQKTAASPRDVSLSSSVSQQRQLQKRLPQHLEETIALKSKQVESFPPQRFCRTIARLTCLCFLPHQVEMLENHNRMLVELLSKQHPSGSLAADKLQSLMKVQ
jgi:hypothetical protein